MKEKMKTKDEILARRREVSERLGELDMKVQEQELNDVEKREYEKLSAEYNQVNRELDGVIKEAQLRELTKPEPKSANAALREYVKAVKNHQADGEIQLRANSQDTISSSVIQGGDVNNMTSAGLPITIKTLLDPLEMGTVYDKLGMEIATNVHGTLQWPHLDTAAEVTVGGELTTAGVESLDFSKIVATPYKLSIAISVSNEAINDAAFDLVGCITKQMNKAVGRVLNSRVLAISTPNTAAGFCGPIVAAASSPAISFNTPGAPTYAEIKGLKGEVLATGAEMNGFCYIMDASMYSYLETEPKDQGSGRFVIENGTIDGDPVFLTSLSGYSGKVAAGCFAYVALNQHGPVWFIVDPYTMAAKNATRFVLSADFSITTLESTPFAVGA